MTEERLQQTELQAAARQHDHLVNREMILAKAKELAGILGSSEEVQVFRKAEEKIQDHQRIQQLIATMKKKQKEIVAFESLKNQKMIAKIETELQELQEELDGIPIVTEFQQSQVEINELLQMVIMAIRDTVAEKVNVEEGKSTSSSNCSD
ncbi:RicAFT regulatory complex protein RicA family protein [Paenibacillus polymyxa]|uniref:RicAFT regulatory complex protein RicA family protein n=1 Tax=Paenibacillus polymyxa TaxID=1406 RepID=UPI00234ABC30|nr:YlbF family regulator [Paenibacillus polymyxa]WCM63311.1 YlbF family regulator [Paenibacillus polymyxa]